MIKRLVLIGCGLASVACGGQESLLGASEPFRVRGAQFMREPLPGFAPSQDSPPDSDTPLRVTRVDLGPAPVVQGQGGRALSGRISRDSTAVGLALDGYGGGYWLIPAGDVDAETGEFLYSGVVDFDSTVAPGIHYLRGVALGDNGQGGPQLTRKFCVTGAVPDNAHACDGDLPLPRAVISISWDTNADLDLQVITPAGQVVEAKHPEITTEGGAEPAAAGRIDRDSNANCVVDGVRRESLVWQTEAPTGLFQIYANLADACRQPVVHFKVGVYTPQTADDGSEELYLWLEKSGVLSDVQVNPGSARGLFVSEFLFQ